MSTVRPIVVTLVAAFALSMAAGSADAATFGSQRTYLGCGSDSYDSETTVSAMPRSCFLDWPRLNIISAARLQRITWSGWGRSVAAGRAVEPIRQPQTNASFQRVTLRAFGRRYCSQWGIYLYTRVRVTLREPVAPDFANASKMHTWRTMLCQDVPSGD